MPPKKVKDKKLPEKNYDLLTLEEVKAQEQKYTNHVMELKTCLDLIDEIISSNTELDKQQLTARKWLDFVTCNPLPKPYKPADIRLFISKLKHFEEINKLKNIDWTLSVNEHSILSQNIYRKDITRKTLDRTIKSDFGNEYGGFIGECLSVLKRLEYFLNNKLEMAKSSRSILEDIKVLKTVIQQEIQEFFDRYTYRILCSEDSYMKSIDAISSEYNFSTDNFQIHLWCLKNVPIRFAQLEEPRLIANLYEINMTLHIPSFMLQQNLCIRAIHMNFDHNSEDSKSFSREIISNNDSSKIAMQSLPDCLHGEWLMQLDIQTRVRNSMIQKRLEYEEKLRLFEEAEAKKKGKKQEKNTKEKKSKIVKPTKEPPLIEADMYPNIWMDFLLEEQEQYEKFINLNYNPETLELDENEINLKKYFILGGIYQLHYERKPKHYDFNSFNMTWHEDQANLVIDKNMKISYRQQFLGRRSTRIFQRLTTRSLSMKIDIDKESTDPECPWFVLTIQLPEYLCYWGEPIVCHYETVHKIKEEIEEVEPSLSDAVPRTQTDIKNEPFTSTDPEDLLDQETQRNELESSVLNAKISTPVNCSKSSLVSSNEFQNDIFTARDADGILNVKDFDLSLLLSKHQIRHMERHLIPRIISSYKFPKELREDELEAIRKRPKSKGGTLVRKAVSKEVDPQDSGPLILSYSSKQNNPERIFPIYQHEEPMRIVQSLYDNARETQGSPLSFSQLVNIINYIKKCYQLRVRNTLDLQPYKSKFKLENKSLKKQSKAKLKESIAMIEKSLGQKTDLESNVENEDHNAVNVIEEQTTETALKESTSDIKVIEQSSDIFLQDSEPEIITYSHWTTQYILKSEYDRENCTVTLQTDRLGYLGFAFKRYEHFPFKYWKLEPSENDPENEVIFMLETQYVRCVLNITENGIRGHVTEPTKAFKRNPKMYLIIDKPIKDFVAFKKLFKEKFLNIFADHDASFYIENGYFSEKHLATELHSYNCMAINCTQIKFNFSQWNRLAQRRDIILKFLQYQDLAENSVEVRITPEEAYFVEISELCSDDVDIIKLEYSLTWRNINTYSDLHHLINSMYPAAADLRCKNPKLINFIRNLLMEIRPLSFS